MIIPEYLKPLLINGKKPNYNDVKTWKVVNAWKHVNRVGDNSLFVEVKCKECGAETLFTAKSMRAGTAASCTHNEYSPVGFGPDLTKRLPTVLVKGWGVVSYVPGSKKVKSLYNVVCATCNKEAQFVAGDFKPAYIVECNHDPDVKQGVGSDHAWWSRKEFPADCKGWHVLDLISQNGSEKAKFEVMCTTCKKIALFYTSNYRKGEISECKHEPDKIYGIGSDPSERIRIHPKETTDHKYFTMWKGIMYRTGNPNSADYKDYGARGICLFEEWKDPTVFIKWIEENLGEKPTPQHSINRIDNDGNYEPGNLEWASPEVQARNKRTGVNYKSAAGDIFTIVDLVDKYGWTYNQWRHALNNSDTVEEALERLKNLPK